MVFFLEVEFVSLELGESQPKNQVHLSLAIFFVLKVSNFIPSKNSNNQLFLKTNYKDVIFYKKITGSSLWSRIAFYELSKSWRVLEEE